jgi:serine/threonine-protein kinase
VTGEDFGPYRLDEVIGRGGMGEVWRAFDTVKKRAVALKRLPAALALDPEFQARFRAESELTARLNEPHIIPIHDYGEIDGRLFIDMRLVEGTNLAEYLTAHGPLAPDRAVTLLAQVAAALDAAHTAGLVHRDIKPGNILLTSGPSSDTDAGEFVYLADFGIARASAYSQHLSLTATGATVGTVDYIAPERFTSGHGDHRVDIYALGCVLYQTLTGQKPFPGDGVLAQMHAHIHLPPPHPSQHAPTPAGLDDVISRGMAKNPNDRYPTASALTAAARTVLTTTQMPATTRPAAAPTTTRPVTTAPPRTARPTPVRGEPTDRGTGNDPALTPTYIPPTPQPTPTRTRRREVVPAIVDFQAAVPHLSPAMG